jgi:SAM-dependent methyltransferase
VTATPAPAEKERHGWFRGRRAVLSAELDRLVGSPGRHPLAILDAGCGAGLMLEELATRGVVCGADPDTRAVSAARARGVAEVVRASVEALPFDDGRFALVTCLDVLEHVPDDGAALRELRRVARDDGRLLVAVPALPALWSGHDEASGHLRRYRRAGLLALAEAAGWRPLRTSAFNTLLLPPAVAVRLAQRAARRPARSDLMTAPRAAGALLEPALRAEAALLRRGARLPVGLSLVASFAAGARR